MKELTVRDILETLPAEEQEGFWREAREAASLSFPGSPEVNIIESRRVLFDCVVSKYAKRAKCYAETGKLPEEVEREHERRYYARVRRFMAWAYLPVIVLGLFLGLEVMDHCREMPVTTGCLVWLLCGALGMTWWMVGTGDL
jgi:hypothetical protein